MENAGGPPLTLNRACFSLGAIHCPGHEGGEHREDADHASEALGVSLEGHPRLVPHRCDAQVVLGADGRWTMGDLKNF